MRTTWMNREQKRQYAKRMKTDKMADICPKCGNRARFIAAQRLLEPGKCDVICEYCMQKVLENVNGLKYGTFVQLKEATEHA